MIHNIFWGILDISLFLFNTVGILLFIVFGFIVIKNALSGYIAKLSKFNRFALYSFIIITLILISIIVLSHTINYWQTVDSKVLIDCDHGFFNSLWTNNYSLKDCFKYKVY